jgi:two-component system, cell cycle sensor histidine kinase and response regulator CckA
MTPHALIVDDEPAVLAIAERVLRAAGYRTSTASNGQDALAMLSGNNDVDVLITDLMMPGMTGDELSRRIRTDAPDVPVLYLTGFTERLFAERKQLWEGEAFLEKPFTPLGLVEAVSMLLPRTSGVRS